LLLQFVMELSGLSTRWHSCLTGMSAAWETPGTKQKWCAAGLAPSLNVLSFHWHDLDLIFIGTATVFPYSRSSN